MKNGVGSTKLNAALSQKICGRLSEEISITKTYDALGRKKFRIFGKDFARASQREHRADFKHLNG